MFTSIKITKITKKSFIEYDGDLYEGISLRNWAEAFAKRIPKDVTHLISAGTSGSAIAFAVLMLRPSLKHYHVHPKEYKSHRGTNKRFSGITPNQSSVCALVDDFVETGATIRNTFAVIEDYYELRVMRKTIKYIVVGAIYKDDHKKIQELADELNVTILAANNPRKKFKQKNETK